MLLPFGGVAEVDEHGNRSLKEELIVTLSGPVQHIWLQAAAFLLSFFGVVSGADYELFTYYNSSFLPTLFFNLLPILALLNGGKLLFLLFSYYHSFQQAHHFMLIASTIFLSIYVPFPIVSPSQLNMWVITTFFVYSLYMEHKQRMYTCIRFLLERYYGKQTTIFRLKPIIVNESDSVYGVLLQFQRGCKHPIIVERDGHKLSELDENELLHAYFADKRTTSTVGDLVYAY